MKSRRILTGALFAGAVAFAGGASAAGHPYGMWSPDVSIDESFNTTTEVDRRVDDSFNTDVSKSEDNDYTKTVSKSEDNDYTKTVSKSEDNDITKDLRWNYESSSSWESSVDTRYDVTKVGDLNSRKFQNLDAGHEAQQFVGGSATGHSSETQGGDVVLALGNDDSHGSFKPVVNTADNNVIVTGDSYAPIVTDQTMAGGSIIDLSGSGFGNTTSLVKGDVLQRSDGSIGQSGDSSNRIQDPMSVAVQR